MVYIYGFLILTVTLLIIQKLLPEDKKKYIRWYWLGLVSGFIYAFITHPYRLERVINDLMHLLG